MKASPVLITVCLALSLSPSRAETSDEELAKQLQNPVASLISVPFQLNWDTEMGPLDQGEQFKLNFQPVVPIALNEDWNLIVRTIVPYLWQEDVLADPAPGFPGVPGGPLAGLWAVACNDLRRPPHKSYVK